MDEKLLCLAYQKLFATLQKGGIDRICQTAYELLGKPVEVINEELSKLAQCPDEPLMILFGIHYGLDSYLGNDPAAA